MKVESFPMSDDCFKIEVNGVTVFDSFQDGINYDERDLLAKIS